jgi:hypothetical protein
MSNYLLRLVTRTAPALQTGQLAPNTDPWPVRAASVSDLFESDVAEPLDQPPIGNRSVTAAPSPNPIRRPMDVPAVPDPPRVNRVRTARPVHDISEKQPGRTLAPRQLATLPEQATKSNIVEPVEKQDRKTPKVDTANQSTAPNVMRPSAVTSEPLAPHAPASEPARLTPRVDLDIDESVRTPQAEPQDVVAPAKPADRTTDHVDTARLPARPEERSVTELRPAVLPTPAAPNPPPRLTIGRLMVEVVPVPAPSPAQVPRTPRRRASRVGQQAEPAGSKLRFGLGQM